MSEIVPNTVRPLYEDSHERLALMLQVVFGLGGNAGMNPVFQVSVEIFVGGEFRGVGRKMEEVYLILMCFSPFCHFSGMMYLEVVEDKIDLSTGVFDQPLLERDELLGGHRFSPSQVCFSDHLVGCELFPLPL